MPEFNLKEVLAMTIPQVAELLPQLATEQLDELHQAEKDDQARDGIYKIIHDEQEQRKPVYSQREVDEHVKNATSSMFTQQDIDTAVKSAVDAITAKSPASLKNRKPRQLALPKKGEKPAKTVAETIDEADVELVFADNEGTEITDLVPLSFAASDFAVDRDKGTAVLKSKIQFPVTTSETEVRQIWLLNSKGKPIEYARLAQPLAIGGGRASEIPEHNLRFG